MAKKPQMPNLGIPGAQCPRAWSSSRRPFSGQRSLYLADSPWRTGTAKAALGPRMNSLRADAARWRRGRVAYGIWSQPGAPGLTRTPSPVQPPPHVGSLHGGEEGRALGALSYPISQRLARQFRSLRRHDNPLAEPTAHTQLSSWAREPGLLGFRARLCHLQSWDLRQVCVPQYAHLCNGSKDRNCCQEAGRFQNNSNVLRTLF